MSTSHSQETGADRSGKRRKRKERVTSHAPEPKNIVSGAGQPLDVSVRRELEEQLGHDFGRVRLHTDRDAGALTEMLGADAVAVGQDIFFREGAYRPGTPDGRRLLAHELLHTVQNPHGLGALRAGRDLGAVSLPQQAMEREAESAAQDVVRGEESRPDREAAVAEGQSTPGWLRYATVDADRARLEQLDPATLVDRLANGVLRSLRGDPRDLSGRVRWELGRLSPQLQDSVLGRLEARLLTPEYDRLLDLVEESETGPESLTSAGVPAPEIDLFEELGVERTRWKRAQQGARGSDEQREADAREEAKEAAARDSGRSSDRSRAAADAAAEDQEAAQRQEQEEERAESRKRADQEQKQEDEKQSQERQRVDEASDERAQDQQEGTERTKEERKAQRDREEQDPEQAGAPGADKRKRNDDATKPAAGSKREDVDPKAGAQPGRVRPEKVDERAEQRDSALSEHGLHEQDESEDEPREEEKPLGLEAGAGTEIGTDREGDEGRDGARREQELKPEDHLPDTDPDLSGIPTADRTKPGEAQPSVPAFPAPPPTKAERVAQEREKEQEEQDEDTAAPEAKAPGQDEGTVEGEAPQPEGGPAAEAQDRSAKDLQTEQSTEQEVGPDPETTDKERQEPEAEKPEPAQDQEKQAAEPAEREDGPDARDEQRQLTERGQLETRRGAAGAPQSVADGPSVSTMSSPGPATTRPAGAEPQRTSVEDRNPSPAARREAEPPKPEREAAGPKSGIPKETGPGATPRGTVGRNEPAGPTAAAGPGAAPSAAQAAVSPVAEQAAGPAAMGAPAPEGARPAPEASLEKDGGGCAPPEPAAEKEEAGGSCGGGGGAAPEEKKDEAPPDVSGQDPKAAIGTVSKLAPDQAAAAMPGVDAAADKKVGEEQRRLAARPPTRERPSGAPRTQSGPPEAAPPAAAVTGKVEKLGPQEQGDKQQAKGSEKAAGAKPTDSSPPPPMPVAAELSADEAKNVEAAADAVPTVDPELRNKTVGPAPKIRLEGASDPKRTDDQARALKEKQADIQRTGRDDAAKPMGEDQIFPDAPREQLVGKATGRVGGKGRAGGANKGSSAKPGVGAVAQQERGGEIQGAAGQAQGDVAAKEKEQQQGEQQAKHEKQTEIDREVAQNAEKQTAERGRTAEQAQRERESWRSEQDKKITDADTKSEKEHGEKNKEIVKARDDKDKEVNDRKDKDNQQIDTERENAEKEAEKKKEEKKPSGGFFGWIADKVKGFFNALLEAVTAVFDAARKAVNSIIDTFKEWADKAIDFVRDLAIKAINVLADALIAIGDVLLAAFPELRDKFRKAIEGLRDKAIDAVNRLADGLKKAVNALLDALAAGLNKLLDVLEAGLKAVIKAYEAVILGAIKFAQAAIEALGKFAALVADIAPDPGGWLSKAGSSAKTGIQDHLWGAIKTGVKRWFDTKVEGILGLGKTVIDVLVKGCVSVKQIGKMAWDAIIASLPMMIASIVIEKVVSMLVPAAGAILTIVQGLMAAWQSLSSILTAFGKFWAYLKAVKAGPAACLFAEAVAAGIVALLDFIANFLMIRLAGATKGVGKRLKAMAQKIMQGLKKTGKGAKKAAGSAVNKARDAMRKANEAMRRPATAPKPKAAPSPNPKSPVKPKDTATPKGPAKPKDTTPERSKDQSPNRGQTPRKDTTPEAPTKKKEIEGPKPTRPKKPKSPLGNALGRAKRAVKSALKKVRNAAKTLGKKLKKSRPGKALKNSAAKLRNAFTKRRDRLRGNRKNQQEQKKQDQDEQRKRKDQQHDDRLGRAVARMRPVLKALLRKGVPARVLDAALAGMRMWYRLSRVAAQGSRRFTIRAWASPPKVVVPGTKVEIEPREALRFVEQLAKKVRDESRARKTDGVSVATDAETGKVTHVRAGEGTRFSDVVAHLDEIQAQNRFPEHGAKKGKKEDGEEYDLPGEWELGWAGEAGGVNMHEQPGSVNTLAHMRKEGQKRGSPPPYQKLAKEKGVHGYKYLFKHGADYLRLFQGKIVGNMSKLNRLKARTLMALTGYNEKRRDETARVYSAMLAKMLERASTQNDYKLIPAAIAEYPMAAQGAQGAAPSKEAWVSGKSEQKQLEELDKKYEGLLKSASTDDERKALHAKKSREKRGITGADVNVAERRNKNGKVTRPAGVKHMVSGEELAAREIQYINMFLSGYTFDYADDVDPQKVKEDVFRKIEREVLDAHGLN